MTAEGGEISIKEPPPLAELRHLQASDMAGAGATLIATGVMAGGVSLALTGNPFLWVIGQLVLALAFVQWFVILHEAGHGTLFRTRLLNRLVGHVAGAFALIPFYVWQRIHARHHKYTGWQDLDATTALLVPRPIAHFERIAVNFAWRTGLPLFSILYRLQNFWNLPRIAPFLGRPEEIRRARRGIIGLGLVLLVLVIVIGPWALASTAGVGLLLSLALQDILLLSQHTHMPRQLSNGEKVRPFPPTEQEPFTRSLLLPGWLSRLLLRFDLHELHHLYIAIPGYRLHRIPYAPANQVHWLQWLRAAKGLKGIDFLFGKREQTGMTL